MQETIRKNFGKNVAKLRKQKQFTQQNLAELTGLSLIGISQIERGQKFASEKTIINLCTALDCSLEDLFNSALKPVITVEGRKKLKDINNLLENHPEFIAKTFDIITKMIN